MDDITTYDDAQVGTVARVVHQGCKAALREHFEIRRLREEGEGSSVTIATGYPADEYRLIGKISGPGPFSGNLVHHGWKTHSVKPCAGRPRPAANDCAGRGRIKVSCKARLLQRERVAGREYHEAEMGGDPISPFDLKMFSAQPPALQPVPSHQSPRVCLRSCSGRSHHSPGCSGQHPCVASAQINHRL